jgi:glyoxylate/hydroxypyruvate reductase A
VRVHVQNDPADPDFAITPAQWRAAAAGEPPHEVTFADDPGGLAAARGTMEVLVAPPAALRPLRRLAAPRLRLIFINAAGVDALAPFDWLPAGVTLLNNRGTHGPKAGEYVAMASLMLAGRLPALFSAQRAGQWRPIHTAPLAGRTALIIGTGDLGSAAARYQRALGVRVHGVNTTGRAHPDFDSVAAVAALDQLLPEADIVVLACPLTAATHHVLDRRRLCLLPARAGIVNIGRGKLLDQDALCDALEQGRLAGAVLDVVTPEPLPAGHRLWATPNVVITPHVSCDDPATYSARSLAILFANLRAWRAGEALPNRVDLARGY